MLTPVQAVADHCTKEMVALRAEIERLRAELATCEEFLREYHRSNANWHNDRPTSERVESIRAVLSR
jgi:hypothetical protein